MVITGRKKELVVIRGRNIWPVDIENQLKNSGVINRNCVAFGYCDPESGAEKLAVGFEFGKQTQQDIDEKVKKIQSLILNQFGVRADQVFSIPPRSIPKTANGKIRRNSCESMFIKNNSLAAS